MNKFEMGVTCVVAVIFVILATSLPVQTLVAFLVGYLISMIISPFFYMYMLMRGLEVDDWNIEDGVEVFYEESYTQQPESLPRGS